MLATVCAVAVNPCPAPLDSGFRSNLVGILGANRYTVLPFVFVDGVSSVTGTVVAADVAGKFIYLVGFGAAASTAPINIDIAISQNYVTTPGTWTFRGFNIGSCNANATADADSVTSRAYARGNALALPVTSLCSPFAQSLGSLTEAVPAVTNLTAAAIFSFNGADAQAISLPWGDVFPDLALDNLTIDSTTTLPSFESALQSDGLSLTATEPGVWAMLVMGLGLIGAVLRRRAFALA